MSKNDYFLGSKIWSNEFFFCTFADDIEKIHSRSLEVPPFSWTGLVNVVRCMHVL